MARRGRKPSNPPQRRAKGDGSLYQRGDRWIGEVTVNVAGERVRRRVSGKTREAAARALRQLLADADAELDGHSTVAEVAEDWCSKYRRAGRRGPTTVSVRLDRVHRHIVDDPRIAGLVAANVTPRDVERWLQHKIDDGWTDARRRHDYSRSTIASIRGDLSQIYRWAIQRRLLQWNPVPVAEVDDVPESSPRRTLTVDQATALVRACVDNPRPGWGTYALTCLLLGARPGEAAGLRWDRIDFDAGTVRIDTAMKRANGGRPLELGPLKTARSDRGRSRTVEAHPLLLAALRAERTAQARDRLMLGSRWAAEWDGLVFVLDDGHPPVAGTLLRGLRRILQQADVGVDDLTVYELRHTYASLLDEAGVAVHEITDALGHRDTRMFYQHYRHRPDPVVRTGTAAWERILSAGAE